MENRSPVPGARSRSSKARLAGWITGVYSDAFMFNDFISGDGPTDFVFGPESAQSHQMETAYGFQDRLREFLASGYAISGGHQDFGLRGLISSGVNPTGQYVGSYNYTFIRSGNTVSAWVTNSTTAWSFLYHAPGLDSRPPTRQGWRPLGRINQTYRMVLTCS